MTTVRDEGSMAPGVADAISVVQGFVEAFNRADLGGMVAYCSVPMSILDGLSPHVWQGSTACEDWYRDVARVSEHQGVRGYSVHLASPWHTDVHGDAAYIVVPATMTFTANGKQTTQGGSVFTLGLRRLPEGWRIAAWAWAKGTQ